MFTFLQEILEYQFLQNALWASVLVSIAAGIVGSYITSRRMVFLSGGITHASFGGIGIAYYFGINPVMGALVFAILSAFGIEALANRKMVREDSAIGILWAFGMAIGIIFVFLTPGYAPNLMNFLFGSILTVTQSDLLMLLALDVILIALFWLFINPILFISFDPEFAQTQKVPVKVVQYILTALMAAAIVLSIRVVGIILLISLFSIPPATANFFTKTFKGMIRWSIAISLIGTFVGLLASYRVNIPSGAAIIVVFVVMFALAKLVSYTTMRVRIRTENNKLHQA
ncbi:MAG: metal ABC transporter permease [Tenuifilaceae bacterium]|jgi:zinc transport system permease protein|nr:metal ABC transporter permease [Tenuifilaceae bacterium]